MDDLQDLRLQARSREGADQPRAALDLYLRVAAALPDGARDGPLWIRIAALQRRLGEAEPAAGSYATAVEHLAGAGLRNAALAVCRRAIEVAPDPADFELRRAQLAADEGYAVEARAASLAHAAWMEAAGRHEAALATLERHLRSFPDDASLRAALVERLRAAGRPDEADRVAAGAHGAVPAVPASREAAAGIPSLLEEQPPEPADWGGSILDPHPVEDEPGATFALASGLLPTLMVEETPPVGGGPGLDGFEPTLVHALGAPPAEPVGPAPGPESDPDALPLLGAAGPGPEAIPTLEALDLGEPGPRDEPAVIPAAGLDEVGVAAGPGEALPLIRLDPPADALPQPDPRVGERELPPLPEPATELRPARATEDPREGAPETAVRAEAPLPSPDPAGGYVDFGALVLEPVDGRQTRFQVRVEDPSGDEDRDFAAMLGLFRQHLADNIDPQDAASHYDLGLAFKEMGLLNEAISELQAALHGGAELLATVEVLGECFFLKGEYALVARMLRRAIELRGGSERELAGIRHWLARSEEMLAPHGSAGEPRGGRPQSAAPRAAGRFDKHGAPA